jgi:hypothetical protein
MYHDFLFFIIILEFVEKFKNGYNNEEKLFAYTFKHPRGPICTKNVYLNYILLFQAKCVMCKLIQYWLIHLGLALNIQKQKH